MSSIYDWSSTAGSNSTVGGVNIAEGMSPALVNDAMRQILAIVRQTFDPSLQNFLNASAQLPIASGGTGAATAAAALANLGALSSTYRDIPITAQSSSFVFALTDRAGGTRYGGSAGTATIQPHSTIAWPVGTTLIVRNAGTGALTVTRGSGVALSVNGNPASADATMAIGAIATLVNWGVDEWSITGVGVS